MEENLLGYLLDALDPATQQQVEAYLQEHPEGHQRLDLLRRALEPLEADREGMEPPPDLAERTLARVAELPRRALPRAPRLVAAAAPGRSWWRRADVLVAAGLLLASLLLVPPGINYFRYHQERLACQNNLRVLGHALLTYTEHHQHRFPNVARAFADSSDGQEGATATRNHSPAGLFVPMMVDAGVLNPQDVSVCCPAQAGPTPCRWSLEQIKHLSPAELDQHAAELVPCYAYTLGYWRDNQIQGLRREDGVLPIVSDRPPFGGDEPSATVGNSPNHGGRGQNVLFTDGHVEWLTDRVWIGDDIYTNKDNQVGAGKHWGDNVLGPSAARP